MGRQDKNCFVRNKRLLELDATQTEAEPCGKSISQPVEHGRDA
jgi:hypothetical protein